MLRNHRKPRKRRSFAHQKTVAGSILCFVCYITGSACLDCAPDRCQPPTLSTATTLHMWVTGAQHLLACKMLGLAFHTRHSGLCWRQKSIPKNLRYPVSLCSIFMFSTSNSQHLLQKSPLKVATSSAWPFTFVIQFCDGSRKCMLKKTSLSVSSCPISTFLVLD